MQEISSDRVLIHSRCLLDPEILLAFEHETKFLTSGRLKSSEKIFEVTGIVIELSPFLILGPLLKELHTRNQLVHTVALRLERKRRKFFLVGLVINKYIRVDYFRDDDLQNCQSIVDLLLVITPVHKLIFTREEGTKCFSFEVILDRWKTMAEEIQSWILYALISP